MLMSGQRSDPPCIEMIEVADLWVEIIRFQVAEGRRQRIQPVVGSTMAWAFFSSQNAFGSKTGNIWVL